MKNPQVTRHIILMRHAQSAVKQAGQTDWARTLTPEGEDRARKTGLKLIRLSGPPDYLISSSAVRAKMTAQLVNETVKLPATRLLFADYLFEATMTDWEQQLTQVPPESRCVLCVGHNPVISALASEFAHRTIDMEPGGFSIFASQSEGWLTFRDSLAELNPSTIH